MAVFQGARLRTTGLRARSAELPARSAQRNARGVLAPARPTRLRATSVLMGVTLAGTMLGLVYLTQTLGANATSAQITELEGLRVDLQRRLDNQGVAVGFAADPTEIGRRAKALGLVQLRDPRTLSAP
jgi:hypothetical protein